MPLLCLICGLPGAGKSTVLRLLSSASSSQPPQQQPFHTAAVLLFDDLHDFARSRHPGTAANSFSPELWHTSQRALLHAAALLLRREISPLEASSNTSQQRCGALEGATDAEAALLAELYIRECLPQHQGAHPGPPVVFVEDNFYFRSMRRPYTRLCGELRCSFAALQLCCPLTTCLERNAQRPPASVVPEGTLRRMHEAVSAAGGPDPDLGSIDSGEGVSAEAVAALVAEACVAALQSDPPPDAAQVASAREEGVAAAREATAGSQAHSTDKALRLCVARVMGAAGGISPEAKKALAQHLAVLRQAALRESKRAGSADGAAETFEAAAWRALSSCASPGAGV